MALGMLLLGLLPPPQAVIKVVTANAKTDGCQGDECDESEVCDMIFLCKTDPIEWMKVSSNSGLFRWLMA